jgi:hypothetical protein
MLFLAPAALRRAIDASDRDLTIKIALRQERAVSGADC